MISRRCTDQESLSPTRLLLLQGMFLVCFAGVGLRLFYWQVLAGDNLSAIAQVQRQSTIEIPARRGAILASDDFPLVTNQPAYLLYAYMRDVEQPPAELARMLAPYLAVIPDRVAASRAAELRTQLVQAEEASLAAKLSNEDLSWIPLSRRIDQATKDAVESLSIHGLGFEQYDVRLYPEASLSAQLLGFVGSDGSGNPTGYFGLEGYYDSELTGRPGLILQEKDALGKPIAIGAYSQVESRDGRTLKTYINRAVQLMLESRLEDGIKQYEAVSGEVIVMDPKTGGILGMAALPSYDPAEHRAYPQETYKVPAVADTYEPGSTFKTLVMAAGVDAGVISPDTVCDSTCSGPVRIGGYDIRTWNDTYHPGTTMTEVLENSDNTGMIFVAQRLGKDRFVDYLHAFGIGQKTGIDLSTEAVVPLRDRWGEVDLATGSFGQGLAVTSMQMVSAVGAIANEGKRMRPQVVSAVLSANGDVDVIEPTVLSEPISPETADALTDMMVASAEHGEAQWTFPKGNRIAGKTGTAQIPIQGHYDADRTIASFVGFAPADDPRFVMLVKLREPQSSPWASETAAPLWFTIAQDLFAQLDIN